MKLLIIDEEIPYPLDTGKKIRTYNLLRHLTERMEIRYLAFGPEDSATAEKVEMMKRIGVDCEIVSMKLQRKSGPVFAWKLFANLFSRYPYIVTSHFKSRFETRLAEVQGIFNPDIVMAEWTPYARYFEAVSRAKKVVVAHNIESTIWKRYRLNETDFFKKAYIDIQARKIERFENGVWGKIDGVIAVSPIEKRMIEGRSGGILTELVENGVDIDFFKPSDIEEELGNIVFTGSMDWRPNQDAAEYFIKEIFPLIREESKEARIFIVGRKPPQFIEKMASENIIVTGYVDDVRPYMARASIVVVPLRIGGGSRLKVLEAMAMKKAIVSTKVGAEGLQITDGENILLADNPRDFANACLRALKERELRQRLGENGFGLVDAHYRWDSLARKMIDFLFRVREGR